MLSTIPTPYDDTLLTFKVDRRTERAADHASSRFAWQKNVVAERSDPDPATDGPEQRQLEHQQDTTTSSQSHTSTIGSNASEPVLVPLPGLQQPDPAERDRTCRSSLFATEDYGPVQPQHATGDERAEVPVPQRLLAGSAGSTRLKFGHQLHLHEARRLLLLRRVRLQLRWFDDPADDRRTTRAVYPQGFSTPGAVRQLKYSAGRGQPRPELPSTRVLRPGRLADQPEADAEPRPALGRQHRQAAGPDQQPDDGDSSAAERSAGAARSRVMPTSWRGRRRAGQEFQPRLGLRLRRRGRAHWWFAAATACSTTRSSRT